MSLIGVAWAGGLEFRVSTVLTTTVGTRNRVMIASISWQRLPSQHQPTETADHAGRGRAEHYPARYRSGDHRLGAGPAGCGRPRTEPVITPVRPWNPPPAERAPAPHGRTRRRGRAVPGSGRPGPRTCHPPRHLELISRRASGAYAARPERDHRRSSGTRQRRSGRELACQRVGDGCQGDHGVRWFCRPRPRPQRGGRGVRVDCAGGRGSCVTGLRSGSGTARQAEFHGHVDPMGVAGEVETHGVDLTMQPMRSTRARASRCCRPAHPRAVAVAVADAEASGRSCPAGGAPPRLLIVGWVRGRPDMAAQAPSR